MAKGKTTLTARVYQYLLDFGSITSMEAFQDLGVTRLAMNIMLLKRKGISIRTADEKCTNRWGDTVTFTRYYLEEDGNGGKTNVCHEGY